MSKINETISLLSTNDNKVADQDSEQEKLQPLSKDDFAVVQSVFATLLRWDQERNQKSKEVLS